MTNTEESQFAFSYEVFDRQLNTFNMMCHVLIDSWEDYSTQEMNFDIQSLCTKASRLCYMADQDLVLQLNDMSHQRSLMNKHHLESITQLIVNDLSPFSKKVVDHYRETKILSGHKSGMFNAQMSVLFPKLKNLLMQDGMQENDLAHMLSDIVDVENHFLKKIKMAKYPGVRHEERFWHLFQFYAMTCYLLYHFRRVNHKTGMPLTDEEAGRLTEFAIQQYPNDPKGQADLELYFSTLEYNNDKHELSIEQMRAEQRKLQNEVPDILRLPFLQHVDDSYQLGMEVNRINFTAEEYKRLLSATSKWQILEQLIYEQEHPTETEPSLYNEVFVKSLNSRPVNLEELKDTIAKMVKLVNRKNQWFCVWSVLKHHNLLATNSHEAFARQMMHPDWFGEEVSDYQRFSGDTLREYKRYFSDYDYTQWDNDTFMEQKALFHMTKWSTSLCQKFQKQCQEMEQAIKGWRYLG